MLTNTSFDIYNVLVNAKTLTLNKINTCCRSRNVNEWKVFPYFSTSN